MKKRLYLAVKKIDIPLPEFYVAYNGDRAFSKDYLAFGNDFIKVNVRIVDIRFDSLKNKEPSDILAGYSFFIGQLMSAKRSQNCTDDEAFIYAIEQCKKYGYLQGLVDKEDFIMYQVDVRKILFPTEEELQEYARREGRKEGRQEGRLAILVDLIHRKMQKQLSRQQIINELEMDEDDIKVLDNFENYKYLLK